MALRAELRRPMKSSLYGSGSVLSIFTPVTFSTCSCAFFTTSSRASRPASASSSAISFLISCSSSLRAWRSSLRLDSPPPSSSSWASSSLTSSAASFMSSVTSFLFSSFLVRSLRVRPSLAASSAISSSASDAASTFSSTTSCFSSLARDFSMVSSFLISRLSSLSLGWGFSRWSASCSLRSSLTSAIVSFSSSVTGLLPFLRSLRCMDMTVLPSRDSNPREDTAESPAVLPILTDSAIPAIPSIRTARAAMRLSIAPEAVLEVRAMFSSDLASVPTGSM
mmetsp:Transcript_59944/g.190410  ORF Transcript_59944/g.190410 Transcript_59944/m.190410 type:complete len:280 (+) Transcript_59944:796-1635(+)